MKYPLDKWSRDYDELLARQALELTWLKTILRPEVHADLEQYCRSVNQPVTKDLMVTRQALNAYRAGGIHVCPVGSELNLILADRKRFHESVEYILRSNATVVAQAKEEALKTRNIHKQQIMKNIVKKINAISALFAELATEFENLKAVGGEGGGGEDLSPAENLAAVAAKKDPKLVAKILKKAGEDTLEGVADDDIADILEKIEALDDVEGGGGDADEEKGKKGSKDKDEDGPVTLEKIQELAQELITDGKSDDIKKLLKKFGAEKISKMDKKHYDGFFAKLVALK